jgi:hypothetical protein
VSAPAPDPLGTQRDVIEDPLPVLTARVLVGDHDQPATLTGDAAHLRPFSRRHAPPPSEDSDQPAAAGRRARSEQVEHSLERRRLCA